MREWLSGRALPCQGKGREFESRLPLQQLARNSKFFYYLNICDPCRKPGVPENLKQMRKVFGSEENNRAIRLLRSKTEAKLIF